MKRRILLLFGSLLPLRLAAQTRLADAQLSAPPPGLNGLWGLVAGARRWLSLDQSLSIDAATNTIKANIPAAQLREKVIPVTVGPAQLPILLPSVPAAGTAVKVYRNGMLLDSADPLDYTFAANTVTPGSNWVVGDKIQILYFF